MPTEEQEREYQTRRAAMIAKQDAGTYTEEDGKEFYDWVKANGFGDNSTAGDNVDEPEPTE